MPGIRFRMFFPGNAPVSRDQKRRRNEQPGVNAMFILPLT